MFWLQPRKGHSTFLETDSKSRYWWPITFLLRASSSSCLCGYLEHWGDGLWGPDRAAGTQVCVWNRLRKEQHPCHVRIHFDFRKEVSNCGVKTTELYKECLFLWQQNLKLMPTSSHQELGWVVRIQGSSHHGYHGIWSGIMSDRQKTLERYWEAWRPLVFLLSFPYFSVRWRGCLAHRSQG